MSDNSKDTQNQAEAENPEKPQPQNTSGASQSLRTRTLNGVTFVRRSSLGPMTVHPTGSSDTSTSRFFPLR